jgi:hypothetical protein
MEILRVYFSGHCAALIQQASQGVIVAWDGSVSGKRRIKHKSCACRQLPSSPASGRSATGCKGSGWAVFYFYQPGAASVSPETLRRVFRFGVPRYAELIHCAATLHCASVLKITECAAAEPGYANDKTINIHTANLRRGELCGE